MKVFFGGGRGYTLNIRARERATKIEQVQKKGKGAP